MKPNVIQIIKDNQDNIRFVLDSGAFTAHASGKPIALDDYCRFLDSLDKMKLRPWRYFTLDVINDPKATMKNYEIMLARGFNPVPIFTRGESFDTLEQYYKYSDLVGLGGLMFGQNKNTKYQYLDRVLKFTAGRPVHILGTTELNILKRYRPYMCDSSTLESGARYSNLNLYLNNGIMKMITRKSMFTRPSNIVMDTIRYYGFTAEQLLKNANWCGGESVIRTLGAYSWAKLSLDVQKNLGTLMFLACTTKNFISILLKGYQREIQHVLRRAV
jgi:hypothetical protein